MFRIISLLLLILALASCARKKSAAAPDETVNAGAVSGIYTAKIACTACSGFRRKLRLYGDMRYRYETMHEGNETEPMLQTGRFIWKRDSSVVSLLDAAGHRFLDFRWSENQLSGLMGSGADYPPEFRKRHTLTKAHPIAERHWKLAGPPGINSDHSGGREAYITFSAFDGSVSGSGGCNRLFCHYTTMENRLQLGPIGSTKMACPDGIREQEFFQLLGSVSRFSILADTLKLYGAGEAPLLVFPDREP